MRLPKSALGVRISFAVVAIVTVAACQDDQQKSTQLATAPQKPALTLKSLPNNAPTICVASVGRRDRLLAINKPTAAASRELTALNAVIDDVCP